MKKSIATITARVVTGFLALGLFAGCADVLNSPPAETAGSAAGTGRVLIRLDGQTEGAWTFMPTGVNSGALSYTYTFTSTSDTGITYSSVSGGAWALQDDGRRKSPSTGHNSVTKARVSFIAAAGAIITIQLDVSSQSGYDYAFISTLDNDSATYSSGYYTGSRISGTQSVMVKIPVPTAGSYFVDIGYRKDSSSSSGSDCAWFKAAGAGVKAPVSGTLTGGSAAAELAAGTWALVVDGRDSEDTLVLRGTVTGIKVSAGTSTDVNVRMKGYTEAGAVNGTLSYSVTFPTDVSAGTLTAYGGDNEEKQGTPLDLAAGIDTDDDSGTKTVSGTITLPAGYYRVALDLYKPDGVLSRTGIAHIYPPA